MDFFKKQLRVVLEWTNQQPNALLYRFPAITDEIKNASKLIVGPGQGCMIVYEGKITQIIKDEGIYDLKTSNHPFITSLSKIMQSFESEHKMHIYFFRNAEILNLLWGTPSPIKYVDSVYKFPVHLGVSGNYSFRIENPPLFFQDIAGSVDSYTVENAKELFISRCVQQLRTYFAKAKVSYQDIDSELNTISEALKQELNGAFTKLGFIMTDFQITGTAFDDDTETRIDSIADITAENRAAAEGGLSYVDLEKLKALRDAAKNEGGLAGAGLQMGVGLEIGKNFSPGNMAAAGAAASATQSTPASPSEKTLVERLTELKTLLVADIITKEEFEAKKTEILKQI